jgi:hypothetical protein
MYTTQTMTSFKYPGSACICTTRENELIIGQQYDYKESSAIGECKFLADESNEEFWKWKFKWTIHPYSPDNHDEFTCSESKKEKFYYSGMWHIYPQYSYIFAGRQLSDFPSHMQ